MTLDCTLSVEQVGDGIEFALTVRNTGEEAVELTFSDGQTIEVVAEQGNKQDWRYSDGQMFTQALRMETLAPGEQLIETVTWEEPPAGEFEIRAWLCANDANCVATRSITI